MTLRQLLKDRMPHRRRHRLHFLIILGVVHHEVGIVQIEQSYVRLTIHTLQDIRIETVHIACNKF